MGIYGGDIVQATVPGDREQTLPREGHQGCLPKEARFSWFLKNKQEFARLICRKGHSW